MWDLLIKDCRVIDPKNGRNETADIAIAGGKIDCVGQDLSEAGAREVLRFPGMIAQPGIIDMHLHMGLNPFGFKNAALAGVTTALDMSGETDYIVDIAQKTGCGINVAIAQAFMPGANIEGNNPNEAAIDAFIDRVLATGGYGVKILGGHYPLTPDASARIIKRCHDRGVYVAWHAGSTETGSDIIGMKEAVDLANGRFLHLAHINAYCRGKVDSVENETRLAIEYLVNNPNIVSESYLSPRNGTRLNYDENGMAKSGVTRNCLARLGLGADIESVEKAIRMRALGVIVEKDGLSSLIEGEDAIEEFRRMKGDVGASFDNVNPFLPRAWLLSAKRPDGSFVVDALGTDGGCIPRNVILDLGMSFVKTGAVTENEFAIKTSLRPAQILNLPNKGHFSVGADADITIYDKTTQKAVATIVGGQKVLFEGKVVDREATIIANSQSEAFLKAHAKRFQLVDPDVKFLHQPR